MNFMDDGNPNTSEFGNGGFKTQRGSLEQPNFQNLQSFDRTTNGPAPKRIHT